MTYLNVFVIVIAMLNCLDFKLFGPEGEFDEPVALGIDFFLVLEVSARRVALALGGRLGSMTPLQDDPQQHQCEAKHRTVRVSCGPDLSPDSDSARKALQKSSLDSKFGPQTCDLTGAPKTGRFGIHLLKAGGPSWMQEALYKHVA
jgi:hypothetical protein